MALVQQPRKRMLRWSQAEFSCYFDELRELITIGVQVVLGESKRVNTYETPFVWS